ncbi:MAG: helix-turn-helix domain-containing protein [Acidobacteriota bacterium]
MSSLATLNDRKYRLLLGKTLPAVIKTEDEYRRMMAAIGELMEKPEEDLSVEEGRLLELLAMLAEEYEDRRHPLPKGRPHKMLAYLLEENALKPSDLWTLIPKSRVSEILSGKRSVSKDQAKRLARFFRVPVDLFL